MVGLPATDTIVASIPISRTGLTFNPLRELEEVRRVGEMQQSCCSIGPSLTRTVGGRGDEA
jgi:hypothetical protein